MTGLLPVATKSRRTLHAIFRAGDLARYPITDVYHGHEIALLFGDHFCFSRGVWWLWEKSAVIWQETTGRQFAHQLGDHYRADAKTLGSLWGFMKATIGEEPKDKSDPDPNKALRERLNPWVDSLEAAAGDLASAGAAIENMRGFVPALAMAEHLLFFPGDGWDPAEDLLACQNGVVDMRTGELHPPAPDYRCTRIADVAYDLTAQAPRFHAFLEQMQPDPEVRHFLQVEAGYCATGSAKEQRLSVYQGVGANGKGTYINLLMSTLRTYAVKSPSSLLTIQPPGKDRYDLAAVSGARMVSISETSDHLKLDENMLKSLTGGDVVSCRHPYGRFYSYTPTYSLLLDTNHPLAPRETGPAMWRRLNFIRWPIEIPLAEHDKELGLKLRAERQGVLNWQIQGAKEYYERGLPVVEAITKATQEQRAASDDMALWIEQKCILVLGARGLSTPLLLSFQAWTKAEGDTFITGTRIFAKRMKEKGFVQGKSGGTIYWHGIRLRTPEELGDPYSDLPHDEAPGAAGPPLATKPLSKTTTPEELGRIPGAGQIV
jgi:P4 family phage/plasmid primase-like protien